MTAKGTNLRLRARLRHFSIAASLLTAGGILTHSASTDARMRAYHFVGGLATGKTSPKVLFVLDTSGSMAFKTEVRAGECDFEHCEDFNHPKASRMSIARDVIQSVVSQSSDNADFALMTFSRRFPPQRAGEVPTACDAYSNGGAYSLESNDANGTMDPKERHRQTVEAAQSGQAGASVGYGWNDCNAFWECDSQSCIRYLPCGKKHAGSKKTGTCQPERKCQGGYCLDHYPCNPKWPEGGKAECKKSKGKCPQWEWCEQTFPCTTDNWGNNGGGNNGGGSGADEWNGKKAPQRFRIASSEDNHDSWTICGHNKPYPYLRHDNLGTSADNRGAHETGDLPDSPINRSNHFADSNSYRRVQYLPRFMGNRVHFPADLDLNQCGNQRSVAEGSKELFAVCNSFGDFGNNTEKRRAHMLGHDFYYWPYVDGFPGYSQFNQFDSWNQMGVASHSPSLGHEGKSASLLAPFFIESANHENNPYIPDSRADATSIVLGHTNPLISGGLDASNNTPWSEAIGEWSDGSTHDNRPIAHTTVSSYVSYVKSLGEKGGVCSALSVILITDGKPNDTDGLYRRLADLRLKGEADVYVVGFGYKADELNDMACAAAGSSNTGNNSNPCNDSNEDLKWETCYDPEDRKNKCAYVASNRTELIDRLSTIVQGALELNLESGPGTSVNEFGSLANQSSTTPDAIQTSVSAHTAWPGWRGTVSRKVCEFTDPDNIVNGEPAKMAYCDESRLPFPDPKTETFGPGPLSRNWDAGTILQSRERNSRLLYFIDKSNALKRINTADGRATTDFRSFYDQNYAAAAPQEAGDKPDANAFVEFLLGKDWPDNWKLPGLAQSSPMVVRRIPQKNMNFRPTVPIRDPHCAGRKLGSIVNIPKSLEDFSDESWDPKNRVGSKPHLAYQEAVMVGDDMGFLHAFHLDSGNEMWAVLPHFMLRSAVASYHQGPENMGQPPKLEDHIFGLGGTINHAYAYQHPTDEHGDRSDSPDPKNPGKWRHLAVIGTGQGGEELMALDLSHMSPHHPDGPLEVLWTSEDQNTPRGATETLAATYDRILGETWSRPAISYRVAPDSVHKEPETIMILGSGYDNSSQPSTEKGRSYHVVDPFTGRVMESATLMPSTIPTYSDEINAVSDVAVATHCTSRFWGEAQEAYFTDPSGRLYRWDLAGDTDHSGDSNKKWTGEALPAASFLACEGANDYSCTVQAGNHGEPFYFPPAVISNNRIDDELADGLSGIAEEHKDNFLIALTSGHLLDEATDSGKEDMNFHPSIYLIVDDHRGDENHAGFSIPTHGPITGAGKSAKFFRLPISSLRRDRKFVPFEGAEPIVETNEFFSKRARPIAAPRITVTGLIDGSTGSVRPGIEVYYIEYSIFEPGLDSCDSRLYNKSERKQYQDPGSSYTVRLRVLADDENGFDLKDGAKSVGNLLGPDGYGFTKSGLEIGKVEQIKDDCENGGCGPKLSAKKFRPCVPENKLGQSSSGSSVGMGYKLLESFSPIEYNTKADSPEEESQDPAQKP